MNYDVTTPCNNCPFRRKGGVRLRQERVEEIAEGMLDRRGRMLVCHKTTVDVENEDGEGERTETPESSYCAGALIFAEKNRNATQLMRIAERLGMYDRTKLRGHDDVFDDMDEMLEANAQDERRRRRRRR